MFKHALIAVLAVCVTAPLAQADLIPGDPIGILGTNDLGGQWGTGVLGGLPNPFGGFSFYSDDIFGDLIIVTSTELPPPPDKKFAAEILIDYSFTLLYLGQSQFEHIDIVGIKEPGQINFINTVESTDQFGNPLGLATTDGFKISFDAATVDILNAGRILNAGIFVVITWTQSVSVCPWDCSGNDNGEVDVIDFFALISEWGLVGQPCDFDGNGVDVVDFFELIGHWGPCPF